MLPLFSKVPKKCCVCVLQIAMLFSIQTASAQDLSLDDVIQAAKNSSVQALEARSSFVSDYWAWRSYLASRLPSLSLYGEVGGFDRSLRMLQDYQTGELNYVENYNMQNSVGLRLTQNIFPTGGTFQLYSNLSRIDQFGKAGNLTWYAQPVTMSYTQPLFAYNSFKWSKKISPLEYENAKRNYLESMEEVSLRAVDCYTELLCAQESYNASLSNFEDARTLLSVARNRASLGTVSMDEVLQLELGALNDSIAINENWVLLKKAQMNLSSLLGTDSVSDVVVSLSDNLPDVNADYQMVLDKSFENSSFRLSNEIDAMNADAAVERAKADMGISMQLNARFGLSQSAQDLSHTYANLLDQEVVGLTFSVPIFDWGRGKGGVKKAQAAADVVKAQIRQAENDYAVSIFTAVSQFNNQYNQCNVSRRARDISANRYELVREKFRSGTASVTDLGNARSDRDNAQTRYVRDICNFWSYYYALRKLTLYDFESGADIDVDFDEMVE